MAKTVFVDGDPSQGVLGTIVDAAFLNLIFQHRHDGANQDGSAPINYALDDGAANAYVFALTPALTARVLGMPIYFSAANPNTGASTVNDGLGIVPIKRNDGTPLQAGDIPAAGSIIGIAYDGAAYRLVSGGTILTTASFVAAIANVAGYMGAREQPPITVADNAATIDWSQGNTVVVVCQNNSNAWTLTLENMVPGQVYRVNFLQNATGGASAAPLPTIEGALIRWIGGAVPTLSTTAAKVDGMSLEYSGALGCFLANLSKTF